MSPSFCTFEMLKMMSSVESVARKLLHIVGASPWRNKQATKRNAISLALFAALTFLWCYAGSNTATTINVVETRQEKELYNARTTRGKQNELTFIDTSSLANVTLVGTWTTLFAQRIWIYQKECHVVPTSAFSD